MSTQGAKFLTVVDAFAGYCQICSEPKLVGRIAVADWPHHGTICPQCLVHLAEEVDRRAALQTASLARDARGLAFHLRGNGGGPGAGRAMAAQGRCADVASPTRPPLEEVAAGVGAHGTSGR